MPKWIDHPPTAVDFFRVIVAGCSGFAIHATAIHIECGISWVFGGKLDLFQRANWIRLPVVELRMAAGVNHFAGLHGCRLLRARAHAGKYQ